MKLLKKVFNYIVNQDYTIRDAKLLLKLRIKIYKNKNKGIIKKIYRKLLLLKYKKICYKNNSLISISTYFKEEGNVSLPHGLCGIFISGGAKIGKNCTIFQQVTIGSNTLKDSKNAGIPIIGDNVYIGAGAKIIGNVKVGNNVRIGANAIVIKDIPDNATVILKGSETIYHDETRNNDFVDLNNFKKK